MSEQNKETAVFWVPWGIGPVCAILAVAASGWPQMLGEGYLSFMALLNAALAVAAVNSSRLLDKLAQARVARRTPPLIEWASIGISILVGITLGNLVLIVCPVVYGVLKHRFEHLYVQLSGRDIRLAQVVPCISNRRMRFWSF